MNKYLAILLGVVAVGAGFLMWTKPSVSTLSTDVSEKTKVAVDNGDTSTHVRTITGTVNKIDDKISTYVSDKYKFKFSYPSTWRVEGNQTGYNTLQLLNYSDNQAGDSGRWAKGMNKIEMTIIDNPSSYFSDYSMVETTIAGQKAWKGAGGLSWLSYAITLPSGPAKYLAVTIYGDSANYYVLEDLLKSLTWL